MPRNSFVGRGDAAEEVGWRLQMSGLVTLTGPGGVGKTRLALEVVARLGQDGHDVAVVELAAASEPGSVVPAIAAAVGLAADSPSVLEAVVDDLGDDPLVLVLDTCEHLRPWCAEVAERLLGACGGLRILATSRQRLGVAGEVGWPLAPLSLPESGTVLPEAFVASEAVQLFCDRAAALQRGFLPTPDNVEAIVDICRRLDANPLAIELAAAHVVALPPAEIAARLDDRLALLAGRPSTACTRHRSLRAALDWSYQLLSLPERALLWRLSVFTGRFTLAAAEAVGGGDDVEPAHVLELLTSLVDKSLVGAETSGRVGRFRLSETMRAYAADRLAEPGRTRALAERHAAWCLALVEDGDRSQDWVERVVADADSLGQALEWALAEGREELALSLVHGQMGLWERRGHFADAAETLERVLVATPAGPRALRASVLHDAGLAALMAGDLAGAQRHLRAAIALSPDGPDPNAAARSRTLAAFAATFGDDAGSVEALEHAAGAVRATGDDALLAEVLATCGQARMFRGDPAAARRHFGEALELARGVAHSAVVATALIGLGSAEVVQGDHQAAEGYLQAGAAAARRLGDSPTEVVAETWLGELALVRGEHDDARRLLKGCLSTARAMEASYPLARSLLVLGRTVLDAGDPVGAQPLFDEADAVARPAGLAHLVVQALVVRAQAAIAVGDAACARARLDEALPLARRRFDRAGEALALESCAELSEFDGDPRGAASGWRQGLRLQAEIGDPVAVARCVEALGRLAARNADFSVAVRLLAAAESVRDRHGCPRPASQVGEHGAVVQSVRQALGESFDSEWRRGEGLSTEGAVAHAEQWRSRRGQQPSAGWEALTAAERRVAGLVAQGLTNAEIAQKIGAAPATVKAHLRRVFAKLDVQTRGALAAALHRRRER